MKKFKLISCFLTAILCVGIAMNHSVEAKQKDKIDKYIKIAIEKNNYYVIPYSSDRYLNLNDLQGLSLDDLEIARNEIYARHGYQFQQKKFIDYFNNQSWYVRSNHKITTDDLSEIEYANVLLIKQQEEELASGNYNESRYDGDFVIPDSDVRKISSDELKYLSDFELAVARNEIYARHGYIFVSDEWKDFFVDEYWYKPVAYSVTLNDIEEYNVAMILKEEASR